MKNKKAKNIEIEYETSSGNVFADLNIANPEEALAKSELALQIERIITQKKLTQKRAAKILDIDQPKISALLNGKLTGFSLERLFRFLNDLGQDVTIKVKPKAALRKKAMLHVVLPKNIEIDESQKVLRR